MSPRHHVPRFHAFDLFLSGLRHANRNILVIGGQKEAKAEGECCHCGRSCNCNIVLRTASFTDCTGEECILEEYLDEAGEIRVDISGLWGAGFRM